MTTRDLSGGTIPVVLAGGEDASGLAAMLHQFIEQTLAESPRKVRLARRLAGRAVFHSAEDEEVCVRITFTGDRIGLQDDRNPNPADASVTADFLTIAHLTAGQESPFRLLLRRKLKARFSLRQVPFLLAMLRFMQIESAHQHGPWRRFAWPAAIAFFAALIWYVATLRR